MGEFNEDFRQLPRISSESESISHVYRSITDLITAFRTSLDSNELNEFRSREDFDRKVDMACYVWAQNPLTRHSAIDLKSLQALWILDQVVTSANPHDEREYVVHTGDPFWKSVDEQMYGHLETLMKEETGAAITPYPYIAESEAYAICQIDDYTLTRLYNPDSGDVWYRAAPTPT